MGTKIKMLDHLVDCGEKIDEILCILLAYSREYLSGKVDLLGVDRRLRIGASLIRHCDCFWQSVIEYDGWVVMTKIRC